MSEAPTRIADLQLELLACATHLENAAMRERSNAAAHRQRAANAATHGYRDESLYHARASEDYADNLNRVAALARKCGKSPVVEITELESARRIISDGVDAIDSIVAVWESGDLAGAVNMAEGWAESAREEDGVPAYQESAPSAAT